MTMQVAIPCSVSLLLLTGKDRDAVYGSVCPASDSTFSRVLWLNGGCGEDLNKMVLNDALDYAIFKNERVGPGRLTFR